MADSLYENIKNKIKKLGTKKDDGKWKNVVEILWCDYWGEIKRKSDRVGWIFLIPIKAKPIKAVSSLKNLKTKED